MLGAELKRWLALRVIAIVLAWCLIFAGLLSAWLGIVQDFGAQQQYASVVLPPIGGVYGNLGQPNQYADYLCLALASSAYLYAHGRMRGWLAFAAGRRQS